MKLVYREAQYNERQALVANNDGSERDEAPQDSARLALMLIAELSACLHMITGDIVRATDLDEARTYWSRRLMALVELIERTSGNRDSGYRKSQYGEQDAADSSRDTQSIVEQRVK